MRWFLGLLSNGGLPTALTKQFFELVGEKYFSALEKHGIIQTGEPARWYPGPAEDPTTLRRIVENPGDPEYPFVAIPDGDELNESVRLRRDEIALTTTSLLHLLRACQELFGAAGPVSMDTMLFPHTYSLGTEADGREVLFSSAISDEGFPAFLLARKLLVRPTLVIVPARTQWMLPGLEPQHGPGDKVEIIFLEDELTLRKGDLARNGTRHPPQTPATIATTSSFSPFCTVLTGGGEQVLSEEGYRRIVDRAGSYALFVDTLVTIRAGRHPGRCVDDSSQLRDFSLTVHEAGALVELVDRRRALRPAELHCFREAQISNPIKLVEGMRRKVDVKYGRGNWRSIHTLPAPLPEAKQFVFNPPADLRYAIVTRPSQK